MPRRRAISATRATGWKDENVKRLAGLLPPGFSDETGCYCLEESGANVRLGLGQMLSAETLRQIHDRLAGGSVFFQALTHAQVEQLRGVAHPH
jgi:hypothetical protein